jgi:hypothetical protein
MCELGKIALPNSEELNDFHLCKKQFNEECAAAFKWSYRLQGWTTKKLEKKISGIKASTWEAYGQQSYSKNRTVHVLALFSWLSQISERAIYHGNNIERYWNGLSLSVIECVTFACMLSRPQFKELLNILLGKIEPYLDEKNFKVLSDEIETALDELDLYTEDQYLIPNDIDIEVFKYDYYRSIAIALREWRVNNGLTDEIVAGVLGEKLAKYRDYENPDKVVPIAMYSIMRLKKGFQIKDTASFTKHMKAYPEINAARKIQQVREDAILSVINVFDISAQAQASVFIKSFVRFYFPNIETFSFKS